MRCYGRCSVLRTTLLAYGIVGAERCGNWPIFKPSRFGVRPAHPKTSGLTLGGIAPRVNVLAIDLTENSCDHIRDTDARVDLRGGSFPEHRFDLSLVAKDLPQLLTAFSVGVVGPIP